LLYTGMSIIGDIYEEREERILARLRKAEELLETADAILEDIHSLGLLAQAPQIVAAAHRFTRVGYR
jgi:F0F1-type ATP synthase membrane subunit b/b'